MRKDLETYINQIPAVAKAAHLEETFWLNPKKTDQAHWNITDGWSKADFNKYAWYGIFLSTASYNRAVPAYGSDIKWNCICDSKVSV